MTRDRHRRSGRWIALASVGALSSCGPADSKPPLPAVSLPSEAVIASIGEADPDLQGDGVILAGVRDGALSASGRFMVALDQAPPFIKVLDTRTGLVTAFGERGEGPGELQSPLSVDLIGDSVVAVMAGVKLERFSVGGEWLGGTTTASSGQRVTSAVVACGSRIFLYGPPVGARGGDRVSWLREAGLGGDGSRWLFPYARSPAVVGFGGLQGLDGGAARILVWQEQIDGPAGFWVPCDGSSPSRWGPGATSSDEQEGREQIRLGDQRGMALVLPDTLFTGAVARAEDALITFKWEEGEQEVTYLRVYASGSCSSLKLSGPWYLHDAASGGLALATTELVPRLILVDWRWVAGQLSEGCIA